MPARPAHDNSLWESSEQLAAIAGWSAYCMVSPWAVLGGVLTRLAAEDAWTHYIPGVGGGAEGSGTAALYAVTMAPSSKGKSLARSCSISMLHVSGGHLPPGNRSRNLSTPEGMVDFFLDHEEVETDEEDGKGKPKKKKVWVQKRFQALAWIDELGGVLKVGGRNANWLLEALSSGYTGHWSERAVRSDPTPAPAAQTHFSMFAAGQDAGIARLLSGSAANQGWTNRLILLDAVFPEAVHPDQRPTFPPEQLRVDMPDCGNCPVCSGDEHPYIYPETPAIRDEILLRRWENLRSDAPPSKDSSGGHELLAKRRLAKSLAVLHGRGEVSDGDWGRAGNILEHSDALRRFLRDNLAEFVEDDEEESIVASTLKHTSSRNQQARSNITRASIAWRLYKATSVEGFSLREVNNAIRSPERRLLALNGRAAGSPSKQIVSYLHDNDCVDWEGRGEGGPPKRGTVFRWATPPPRGL